MVFKFSLQSEALRKLSSVPRQVVATGGGVVVRHINWYISTMYMKFTIISHCV